MSILNLYVIDAFFLVKKPTGEYGSYPKWYTSDMPENFEINYLNYC